MLLDWETAVSLLDGLLASGRGGPIAAGALLLLTAGMRATGGPMVPAVWGRGGPTNSHDAVFGGAACGLGGPTNPVLLTCCIGRGGPIIPAPVANVPGLIALGCLDDAPFVSRSAMELGLGGPICGCDCSSLCDEAGAVWAVVSREV